MLTVRASRRQFLQAAGLMAAGAAVAGCGPFSSRPTTPNTGGKKTASYKSRPDLAVPIVTTSKQASRTTEGLIFVAPGGPMIADSNGEPVWFHPVPNKNVANFSTQRYRGEPVLTWWEGKVGKGYALSGELVLADTSYKELQRVPAANGYQADLHEFQITNNDTVLFTIYKQVPADLRGVGGPSNGQTLDGIIQEIDIASGNLVFEWHSLDHVALEESHAAYTKGQPYDYFHINSIDVDSDNDLLVSARNTWAVYKIDRRDGAVRWRLGGKKTDFSMGTGTIFAWQHDARRQADGSLTLFDDEAAPKIQSESRGMILDLDERSMSVTLRKAYTHNPAILATSQGNMQVLPNRNVLLGWGSEPYFTEFDTSGNVLLDGKFAGSFQSYRAYVQPWIGEPAESPAIAVSKAGGGLTVYASWNGSTKVAQWQVLGGATGSTLEPVASANRSGFETAISVSGQYAMIAAQALDSSGAVLGTSRAINV